MARECACPLPEISHCDRLEGRFPRRFKLLVRGTTGAQAKAAMTSRRTWWIAVLTTLTMVGGPASVLAVHTQCEVQHHSCDQSVADTCCCGHITGTDSQQAASNDRVAVNAPPAELPTVAPQVTSPRVAEVNEMVSHVGHLAIDRLTLFRVLLI